MNYLNKTQRRVLAAIKTIPEDTWHVDAVTKVVNQDGGPVVTQSCITGIMCAFDKTGHLIRVKRGYYILNEVYMPLVRIAGTPAKQAEINQYYSVVVEKQASSGNLMFRALRSGPFASIEEAEADVEESFTKVGDTTLELGIVSMVKRYAKKSIYVVEQVA